MYIASAFLASKASRRHVVELSHKFRLANDGDNNSSPWADIYVFDNSQELQQGLHLHGNPGAHLGARFAR